MGVELRDCPVEAFADGPQRAGAGNAYAIPAAGECCEDRVLHGRPSDWAWMVCAWSRSAPGGREGGTAIQPRRPDVSVRTPLLLAALVVAPGGCGNAPAKVATDEAPARSAPISPRALRGYTVARVPSVRRELRRQGVEAFGRTSVSCEAERGQPRRGVCLYSVPILKRGDCGLFLLRIVYAQADPGYRVVKQSQSVRGQICQLRLVDGRVVRVP